MKVYLYDHKHSEWEDALRAVFGDDFEDPIPCFHVPEHPEDRPGSVLFVHTGVGRDWQAKASDLTSHVVLVRNDGRHERVSNERGNLHGCFWSPADFAGHATHRQLSRFVETVRQSIDGRGIDWELLHAPATDAPLALRILCEAWTLHASGRYPELLHPPASANDWFAPFGVAAQDVSVTELAGLMEPATVEAQALFEAVLRGEPLDEHVVKYLARVAE